MAVRARLEDQVATRFLSTFLDMSASLNGAENDKEFLRDFPYLAEPW